MFAGHGSTVSSGPVPEPASCLGLVDVPGSLHRVGPDHEVERVGEAVRRVAAPLAVLLEADTQTAGRRRELVDGMFARGVGRARHAEALLVPQVNPRLVADLHLGRHVMEDLGAFLDRLVLRVPAEVGRVEVEEVVVLDPGGRRPAGDHVPHGLEQASGRQVPAGKVQLRSAGQHLHEHLVACERRAERLQLLVHREPADLHAACLAQPRQRT